MRYREFQPSAALSGHIECFWTLEGTHSSQDRQPPPPERLLPDGCIEVILNFGAPFLEHKEGGKCELQPLLFVVGQMTRPVLVSPTGSVQLLGVRFAPGGTLGVFPLPPGELTNTVVPLFDVLPSVYLESSKLVNASSKMPEKVRLIETLLLRHITANGERRASLRLAISTIIASGGQISLDRLAIDSGITGRQLERRFVSEVGIGPKLLCRVLRFQQVFRAVERSDRNWANIAVECGYYDQAHLIRDFQQFAGQTPSVLFDHFTKISEFFVRKHRMSHFYNTAY